MTVTDDVTVKRLVGQRSGDRPSEESTSSDGTSATASILGKDGDLGPRRAARAGAQDDTDEEQNSDDGAEDSTEQAPVNRRAAPRGAGNQRDPAPGLVPKSLGEGVGTDADPRLGQKYGKYQIKRLIGFGGMATVYEAEDTLLNRKVAVKFLPDARKQQKTAVERFVTEAQVAGRLNHPNIIAIFDIGYENETYYIAMELLNPGSAGSYIKKRGRLHWYEASTIVLQCCSALTAAHQTGLVHRDIKPDNILCSPAGSTKLADFGLVKELHVEGAGLTQSGVVVGTPLYMSPEQCSAQPLDARSDIYSLGASYYALLTGSAPYPTGSVPHIMLQHCKSKVPDPRLLAPDVPDAVVRIVERAMAKRPDSRFQTAADFAQALDAVLKTGTKQPYDFLVPSSPTSQTSRVRTSMAEKLRSDGAQRTPSGNTVARSSSPSVSDARNRPLQSTPDGSGMQAPAPINRRTLLLSSIGIVGALGGALWWQQRTRTVKPLVPTTDTTPTPKQPAAAGAPIRVGVLNSLSGTLSISARPVIDATLLAIEEINAKGGVLGRPIEPTVVDGKSDNRAFAREAERLIAETGVVTLFGGWSPSNRRAMVPVVERHKSLLMFPTRDEGLEDSEYVVYCGSTPNQLVIPALQYWLNEKGAQRIYLIGTDGLFSHISSAQIIDALSLQSKAKIVGEHYSLLGETSFQGVIKKIVASKPDVIFNFLIGDSNLEFFKELRASGLTPSKVPTVTFSVGEDELSQLAGVDMIGDYLAASYFQALENPVNVDFIKRFRRKYGDYRITGATIEAAYNSVYLWAQAVEAAGVVEVSQIRSALGGQALEGPGGPIRIDSGTHHSFKPFYMARLEADGKLNIVHRTPELIRPEPFPTIKKTRAEWEAMLNFLYKSWNNNWVNPAKPDPLK